jgi:hypothetical protein
MTSSISSAPKAVVAKHADIIPVVASLTHLDFIISPPYSIQFDYYPQNENPRLPQYTVHTAQLQPMIRTYPSRPFIP